MIIQQKNSEFSNWRGYLLSVRLVLSSKSKRFRFRKGSSTLGSVLLFQKPKGIDINSCHFVALYVPVHFQNICNFLINFHKVGKMETSPLKLSHGWSVLSSFALIVCPPLCPIVWTNLRGLLCDLQWYLLCKRFHNFSESIIRTKVHAKCTISINLSRNWFAL